MPITQKQREHRRKHIGSSDMAPIMGLSVYANAADIYHQKVGDIVEKEEKQNDAIDVGNYLEDGILQWAADRLGVTIRKNQRRVKGVFAANVDAMVVEQPWIIEAKTSGWTNPMFRGEEWGDEMTAEVPVHVLIQTHHQMYVTGRFRAYVPALIPGRGFCLFQIDRNETLIDDIVHTGEAFWQHNVERRVPPADVPTLDTLKVLVREEDGPEAEVDDGLVYEYIVAKEAKKMAEKRHEDAQRALIHALGHAERGISNVARLTYREQVQNRVDTRLLKEKFPEVAEQVTVQRSFRVLRDKKV